MDITEKILEDREKKIKIINSYILEYDCLCVKANIMGTNKNIFESFFLVNYFEKIIDREIPNYELKKRIESYDGTYLLYFYKKGLYRDLKEKTILIEENNKLGRLIDLDVYYNDLGSKSRGHLRKCLICDKPAYYCNRLNNHSYQELIEAMDQMINDELMAIVRNAIDQAVELELALPYKFGCVTLNDSGSHFDMNASIMRRAKEAIIPGLILMFKTGLSENNLDVIFQKIRSIGIDTEREMYLSTDGVNCYKGLIFLLGLLVSSLGYFIKNQYRDINNIFENIKIMCRDLYKELDNSNTYGLKAYQKYKFKGARHEAISGLVNVKKGFYFCNDLSESSLQKTLINIIVNIDDTVMLKRAQSLDKYQEIIKKIKSINSMEELVLVNKYCIQENISTGGACDILICIIFLKLINQKINLNGENYA